MGRKRRAGLVVAVFRSAGWVVWLAVALTSAHGFAADGNELFGLGPIQKSMGGAGVANPKDASWTLLNPASLVDLDRRLDLSMEWFHNRVSGKPRGFVLVSNPGAGAMSRSNDLLIPSWGLVWPIKNGALGLGVFGVEGNRTDFPHPRTTLALISNDDRRSGYQVVRIPFAYAHRFDNGWAVGLAAVPAITHFRTDSLTLRLRPTKGDDRWDEALGCGFEVGVYRNWHTWALGASYTSRTWMERYRDYKDLIVGAFDLPQKLQAGVTYRPFKKWELSLDYKWIDWSSIPLLGGSTLHSGLGWRNQHIIKAGVGWAVSEDWTLRAGFSTAKAVVTSKHVFVNELTPALSKTHVAIGFTHKLDEHSSFDVTYAMAIPERLTDSGKGDIFSHLGKGTESGYEEYSLSAQYSYRF